MVQFWALIMVDYSILVHAQEGHCVLECLPMCLKIEGATVQSFIGSILIDLIESN